MYKKASRFNQTFDVANDISKDRTEDKISRNEGLPLDVLTAVRRKRNANVNPDTLKYYPKGTYLPDPDKEKSSRRIVIDRGDSGKELTYVVPKEGDEIVKRSSNMLDKILKIECLKEDNIRIHMILSRTSESGDVYYSTESIAKLYFSKKYMVLGK